MHILVRPRPRRLVPPARSLSTLAAAVRPGAVSPTTLSPVSFPCGTGPQGSVDHAACYSTDAALVLPISGVGGGWLRGGGSSARSWGTVTSR
jgi:hypothetical protein